MNVDGYCTLGTDRECDLTADELLAAMDAADVQQAVIAPVDRCLAVLNRGGNDFILKAAAAHDDRFIPACTVNPWFGREALAELHRAIDAGARLLVLHPAVQGFQANDELVWPVLEAAQRVGIVVYIHTGPPACATPWQVTDLALRFAGLAFIMGHCGATDFWSDVADAARAAPNVFIEASLARPFVFQRHVECVGRQRGIMGSAAPLNDLVFEWEQMRRVLPPGDWPDVYGENLLGLLAGRRAP